MELSYNDQCDILRGRISRLAACNPGLLQRPLESRRLKECGLDVSGLGVSREQADMALAAVAVSEERVQNLKEAVIEAWSIIGQAKDWHCPEGESESRWIGSVRDWYDAFYGLAE
jgi:hypothetical protein